MERKIYTSLSIPFQLKDEFTKLNIDWNIKNPTQRKTKEEFMKLLINSFKEKESKKK